MPASCLGYMPASQLRLPAHMHAYQTGWPTAGVSFESCNIGGMASVCQAEA